MAENRQQIERAPGRESNPEGKGGARPPGAGEPVKGPDPDPGGRTLPGGRGHAEKGARRRGGGPGEGPSRGRG